MGESGRDAGRLDVFASSSSVMASAGERCRVVVYERTNKVKQALAYASTHTHTHTQTKPASRSPSLGEHETRCVSWRDTLSRSAQVWTRVRACVSFALHALLARTCLFSRVCICISRVDLYLAAVGGAPCARRAATTTSATTPSACCPCPTAPHAAQPLHHFLSERGTARERESAPFFPHRARQRRAPLSPRSLSLSLSLSREYTFRDVWGERLFAGVDVVVLRSDLLESMAKDTACREAVARVAPAASTVRFRSPIWTIDPKTRARARVLWLPQHTLDRHSPRDSSRLLSKFNGRLNGRRTRREAASRGTAAFQRNVSFGDRYIRRRI